MSNIHSVHRRNDNFWRLFVIHCIVVSVMMWFHRVSTIQQQQQQVVVAAFIITTTTTTRTNFHNAYSSTKTRGWNQLILYKYQQQPLRPAATVSHHPSLIRLFGRQRPPKNSSNDDDDDDDDDDMASSSFKKSSSSNNKTMKKENFPSKICIVCQRPFIWRKKWERSWDEITTCSKKCNSERRSTTTGTSRVVQ